MGYTRDEDFEINIRAYCQNGSFVPRVKNDKTRQAHASMRLSSKI